MLSIEKDLLNVLIQVLEKMDSKQVRLSTIGLSPDDDLVARYQERPFTYEFYHQLRLMIDNGYIDFGNYIVHPEVDKGYQEEYGTDRIPDFIIHVPNAIDNLAIIEFKTAKNQKIKEDFNKLLEFREKPQLQYKYAIEIIVGKTDDLKTVNKQIKQWCKADGVIIHIIWFNIDTWKAHLTNIKYSK